MSAAPTAAGPVCWVDLAWDREDLDGITTDPGEFAAAAFRVACGPIMSPGYVRWHPRALDHTVSFGEDPDPSRLVVKVVLATSLPMWLGSPWWSWTTYMGRDWSEPEDAKHAAPARPGEPNLADARAAVRALVAEINQTAGPVLARLEGGERRWPPDAPARR